MSKKKQTNSNLKPNKSIFKKNKLLIIHLIVIPVIIITTAFLTILMDRILNQRCQKNLKQCLQKNNKLQQNTNLLQDQAATTTRKTTANTPSTTNKNTLNIKLFYYNQKNNQNNPKTGSTYSISPITRQIPATKTPIKDTLELLMTNSLTKDEKNQGFAMDFSESSLSIESVNLENGKLTIIFNDPNYFTTGGSARVQLLKRQVKLTAKQFEEVEEVNLLPEELFQP